MGAVEKGMWASLGNESVCDLILKGIHRATE